MEDKLLKVENLQVGIKTYRGEVQAVRNVSFTVDRGEIFSIVGESGCGKSVTAQTLMKLNPSPPAMIKSGHIYFEGRDIVPLKEKEMRKLRGREISMIFQDPMTCLNPSKKVGKQIAEALTVHEKMGREQTKKKVIELLSLVGIPSPEERAEQYPHEYSGGMRQRAMIAMGTGLQAEAFDRRRAYDCFRRYDTGADPGADEKNQRDHRKRDHPYYP